MRSVKSPQHRGQQVGARGRARADRDRPRPQAPQLDRRLPSARDEAERLADERLEETRRGGRPDAASGALEQLHPEERLEAPHVLGDGRLAEVAGLRGAGDAARVQHGEEQLEAMQREAGFGHRLLPM